MAEVGLNGKRLGWVGAGRMGSRWRAACSTPAATWRSTTARARRPSRSPSWERRSSTRPRSSPTGTSSSPWSPGPPTSRRSCCGDAGLLSRRPRARDRRRRDHRVARRRRPRCASRRRGAARSCSPRPSAATRKVVEAGRLTVVVSGPEDACEPRAPYLELLARRRDLRRRGRAGPAREDLPQRDARRGRAVARRDHRAGREGRDLARRLPGLPQRQRHGLDVHPLQDPGARQSRLHADVHARAAAKDFDLGFEAARSLGVPMPVAAAAARDRAGDARSRLRRTSTSPPCSRSRRATPAWSSNPRASRSRTAWSRRRSRRPLEGARRAGERYPQQCRCAPFSTAPMTGCTCPGRPAARLSWPTCSWPRWAPSSPPRSSS